uniref:Uncharacterized protein n=1 Tax=Candidatus Kentrum sp. FW TaxID=2126338 RepID=A0A450RUF6_9GAMM|nr:MAG: hypothetical protein BECKFW1821A_GA0114235_100259 [Candidatus Kentron sp. FW]
MTAVAEKVLKEALALPTKETSPQKKERRFGQFKEPYFMADDFDDELPDAVWLGEQG